MKKFIMSFGGIIASLALFVGISSVNSPSMAFFHQPEIPEKMMNYKK